MFFLISLHHYYNVRYSYTAYSCLQLVPLHLLHPFRLQRQTALRSLHSLADERRVHRLAVVHHLQIDNKNIEVVQ